MFVVRLSWTFHTAATMAEQREQLNRQTDKQLQVILDAGLLQR